MLNNIKDLNSRGEDFLSKGDYALALGCFNEASSLLDKIETAGSASREDILWHRILTQGNLGTCYLKRGEYNNALKSCNEALRMHEAYLNMTGRYHPRWFSITYDRLRILWLLDDDSQFQEIDGRLAALQDLPHAASSLLSLLGNFWLERKNWATAIDRLRRAEELAAAGYGEQSSQLVSIRTSLALAYLKSNMFAEALSMLLKASTHPQLWHSLDGDWQPEIFSRLMAVFCEYYTDKGFRSAQTGERYSMWRCAVFFGKLCIRATEYIRWRASEPDDEEGQRAFLKKEERIYDHVMKLLIGLGRYQEMPEILLLKKRDELFAYMLDEAMKSEPRPITLIGEEKKQYERLRAFQNGGGKETLEKFLDDLPSALDEVNGSSEDIQEVKDFFPRNAGGNSCLLQIFSVEDKDILIVSRQDEDPITKDISGQNLSEKAEEFHRLVSKPKTAIKNLYSLEDISGQNLSEKAEEFHSLVSDPQTPIKNLYSLAEELYKIIFDSDIFGEYIGGPKSKHQYKEVIKPPVINLHSITTLYFALDGPQLRKLPIAALRNPASGQWLIEEHELVTVLFSVLGQTDAVPADNGTKTKNAFMLSDNRIIKGITPQGQQVLDDHKNFLTYLGCNLRANGAFTLANLLAAIQNSSLLYVLSHFRLGDNIAKSKLEIDDPNRNDVSLKDLVRKIRKIETQQARHIDHIDFAACNSGNMHTGKEVECMGGFFLYLCTASTLIATIWPVSSTETPGFMQEFYLADLTLKKRPFALREAAKRRIALNKHPYFWAGYTLMTR